MSFEYIRGLIEGEGSFTFCTRNSVSVTSGDVVKALIPTFAIGMNERDKDLLIEVRDKLGLKNKVYIHGPYKKDGHNRGKKAFLIVREFGALKNIIIPMFYDKLVGNKRIQFENWLEKIGSDSNVPESYKLLYRLHKSGFYKSEGKFID